MAFTVVDCVRVNTVAGCTKVAGEVTVEVGSVVKPVQVKLSIDTFSGKLPVGVTWVRTMFAVGSPVFALRGLVIVYRLVRLLSIFSTAQIADATFAADSLLLTATRYVFGDSANAGVVTTTTAYPAPLLVIVPTTVAVFTSPLYIGTV